ncbi:MAG: 4-hydroxy-tetrahydrodipicolinate reductase [Vulcanimicrobiaceae bacterium]
MGLKVAVAGALGRMGRVVCATVARQSDLELVGGFDQTYAGEPLAQTLGLPRPCGSLYDDVVELYRSAKPDVIVDFSVHPVTVEVARTAVAHGVSPVIGATGWTAAEQAELAEACRSAGIGAALVPNFAIGAVLMMRFAEAAARFFPTAEIIELHHDAKRDRPSGTAKLTAARMSAANGGNEVPTHSVRLRGLVAHQEVLLGGEGEVLTIRHDSLSRESFMAGMLLAVRNVRSRHELAIGLDSFLGFDAPVRERETVA